MFGLKVRLRQQLKGGGGVNTPSAFITNRDSATKKLQRELRNRERTDVGFQSLAPQSPKRKPKNRKKKPKKKVHAYMCYNSDDDAECGLGMINRALEDGGNVDVNAPWEGPDLTKEAEVRNISGMILSLKGNKGLFDKKENLKRGEKSLKNFYDWLEEYCRYSHKDQKVSDDMVFAM
jgi:hypothetical protein